MRREINLCKTSFRYARKPVIKQPFVAVIESALRILNCCYHVRGWDWNWFAIFYSSMGLKQTHCLTTGLLVSCCRSQFSLQWRKWQFLLLELTNCSEGGGTEFVLMYIMPLYYRNAPFTMGLFIYYLFWDVLCAYSLMYWGWSWGHDV